MEPDDDFLSASKRDVEVARRTEVREWGKSVVRIHQYRIEADDIMARLAENYGELYDI
jgi:hypothetical protein